jgi:hypothetical protein
MRVKRPEFDWEAERLVGGNGWRIETQRHREHRGREGGRKGQEGVGKKQGFYGSLLYRILKGSRE